MDEAYPEAAAVLRDAGWTQHPEWRVYTRGSLVMGSPRKGEFHVKDWERVKLGHPQYGLDTPDTPEEAAQWLIERFSPRALATPPRPEPSEQIVESVDLGADILDADYEEYELLAALPALEETAPIEHPPLSEPLALPEPGIQDFAPDPSPPPPQPGAFIFGDDLPRARLLAQGLLAELAATLIAETRNNVKWGDEEFARLSNHVAANLDKGSGLYGGDAESYARFVELSDAQGLVRRIEAYRDTRAEFVRMAGREEVEAFNYLEGWP